jgi:hypothetical protein
MPGKYLIRPDDVPIKLWLSTDKREFEMLLGQKYVGTARKDWKRYDPAKEGTHLQSEFISLTRYTFRGRYKPMYCDTSDRIYYIIDGEVTNFRVGDEVYSKVRKGDLVFIPKDTPYCMDWAECEYMVINGPAFQPGSDKPLDKDHQIPDIPY